VRELGESKSIVDVKKALGDEVVELLNIFEKEGNICLKPKSFLGKDIFNEILGQIRDLGGKYENGLFRIPMETKGLSSIEELHRIVMDFKNHTEKEFEKILKKIGDLK